MKTIDVSKYPAVRPCCVQVGKVWSTKLSVHCKRILVTGKSEGVTKVINNNGVPEVYQVI